MPKKPFYRSFDDWWYVEVGPRGNRKQVKLIKGKKNERAAYTRFCEVIGYDSIPDSPSKLTVAQLCDSFLDWSSRNHEADTYNWYRQFLQDFCNQFGSLKVVSLKPLHLTQWIKGHDWNSTSQNKAISCVKRCLNFAVSAGMIGDNPLRHVRKPPAQRRDIIPTRVDRK